MGKTITVDEDVYEELVRIKGELMQNQGKTVNLSETIKFLIKLKRDRDANP